MRKLSALALSSIALAACSGPQAVVAPEPLIEGGSPPVLQVSEADVSIPIKGEARVLRGTDPIPLLHPVKRLKAAYSYGEDGKRIDYDVERDFSVTKRGIARTATSRAPDFANFTYVPGSPCAQSLFSADCARAIRDCTFGGDYCAEEHDGAPTFWVRSEPRNPPVSLNHVVYFDYDTGLSSSMFISPQRRLDPETAMFVYPRDAIEGEIKSVLCLGDSVTAGAHTIERYYNDNDSQSWCGLLRKTLAPDGISVENASIGGAALPAIAQLWYDRKGDLPSVVFIAVGMNDHLAGSDGLPTFKAGLEKLVKDIKEKGSTPILMGFFQANLLSVQELAKDTREYNEAIRAVAEKYEAPFLDMARVLAEATPSHAPYYHLTGDYLHHPNNYGQRLYYSQVLPFFLSGDEAKLATDYPDYVAGPWSVEGWDAKGAGNNENPAKP